MDSAALEAAVFRNLARVRTQIEAACVRGGRDPDAARLVCVTKGLSEAAAAALVRLGARDLGESRVPQLAARQAAIPGPRWHMIGHLQRRKAPAFLETGALLHSLESPALLEALERRLEAACAERPLEVLCEVNVAREPQKYGLAPEAVPALLDRAQQGGRVRVVGLMAMAPYDAPLEQCRAVFAALRALRDRERERHAALRELSMGMTRDVEVACEEGATWVRVGSALGAGLAAPGDGG